MTPCIHKWKSRVDAEWTLILQPRRPTEFDTQARRCAYLEPKVLTLSGRADRERQASAPSPRLVFDRCGTMRLVAGRRWADFGDPSRARTYAPPRAEIGAPRARGHYTLASESSSATVLRAAALQLKPKRYLLAYAHPTHKHRLRSSTTTFPTRCTGQPKRLATSPTDAFLLAALSVSPSP